MIDNNLAATETLPFGEPLVLKVNFLNRFAPKFDFASAQPTPWAGNFINRLN